MKKRSLWFQWCSCTENNFLLFYSHRMEIEWRNDSKSHQTYLHGSSSTVIFHKTSGICFGSPIVGLISQDQFFSDILCFFSSNNVSKPKWIWRNLIEDPGSFNARGLRTIQYYLLDRRLWPFWNVENSIFKCRHSIITR